MPPAVVLVSKKFDCAAAKVRLWAGSLRTRYRLNAGQLPVGYSSLSLKCNPICSQKTDLQNIL
jgi:hypothetical protein